jgi:hypothetical protein
MTLIYKNLLYNDLKFKRKKINFSQINTYLVKYKLFLAILSSYEKRCDC